MNKEEPKDESTKSRDPVVKEADKPPKQLPNEIIDVILDISKANNDLPGLAAVARTNHQMYNLAIKKLYETITLTEWNEASIGYGTSKPDISDDGTEMVQNPTRKDAAAAFTRKIIFDFAPKRPISRSFGLVKEVVVTAQAFSMASYHEEHSVTQYALGHSLKVLASRNDLSNPLHITFHPRHKEEDDSESLSELLYYLPPSPIICEIRDLPYHDLRQFFLAFKFARNFGATLHFSTFCWRCQSSEATECEGNFVQDLAHRLGRIVAYERETHTDDGSPGQTILCDVSHLILNDNEFVAAAGNENDSAQLKMFKLLHFYGVAQQWSDAQKWDRYVSRIKFVDSGFKPSKADVAASVERRQYLALHPPPSPTPSFLAQLATLTPRPSLELLVG